MHLYLAAISSSTTRGPERTGVWTHTSRTRKRAPFNKGDFCIALSWARPSAVVGAHSSSSTESASRGSDGFSWPSGARTAAKPACQLRAEKHHASLQRAHMSCCALVLALKGVSLSLNPCDGARGFAAQGAVRLRLRQPAQRRTDAIA